jgi:hypothetical protein
MQSARVVVAKCLEALRSAAGTRFAPSPPDFRGLLRMPGLVYTFERDKSADTAALKRRPSTDAIIAIAVAASGLQRVNYEELTDSLNTSPMLAVVFADDESKHIFDKRLGEILRARALVVRRMAPLEAAPSIPPLVAEEE